jgi:polysaccharide pyruvyl transferase WcaK-like protein
VSGEADYHLGDEAMLEANIGTLRSRVPGIELTVFSRAPAWTSRRYAVDAVATPRFPPGLGHDAAGAVRASDGLLVSGGGNLCSSWPDKVLERVELIRVARAHDKPVAVVGQTIGPMLDPEQARLLADVLPWASVIGVRDDESGRLLEALGVPPSRIQRQFDDAFLMTGLPVTDRRARAVTDDGRPPVLVTLDASFGSTHREDALRALAPQLDSLARSLDAPLVFVPHVGGADVPASHDDAAAGRALRDALGPPLQVLACWQPAEVRWLTEQALLVVSSRYHPVVFATAAGVPVVAIHQDEYTRVKLSGALAPAGLDRYCLSLADAGAGALLTAALAAHGSRHDVQAKREGLRLEAERRHQRLWRAVCDGLRLPVRAE